MQIQKTGYRLLLPCVLAFFSLSGCSQEQPAAGNHSAGVTLELTTAGNNKTASSLKRSKPPSEEVQSVRVQVATSTGAPAAETALVNVIPGESLSVPLEVEAGFDRIFIVEAFSKTNGEGDLIFEGQKTVDLFPGTTVSITIEMSRTTPAPPEESIIITPKDATVELLSQMTFTADVSQLSDPELTWSVNDIVGGSEALGVLVIQGNTAIYTAPASFPEANLLTLKAVSRSDSTVFGTAKINLKNPEFQISPRAAVVPKMESQLFTLNGIDPSGVSWTINDVVGGNNILGTIDSEGLYTAPSLIPVDTSKALIGVPFELRIEARSQTNPVSSDMAMVRVMTGPQIRFSENVPISDPEASTRSSGQRSTAFYQGTVYATWSDGTNIFFAKSQNRFNWTNPELIFSCTGGSAEKPAIAIGPQGEVYIILEETIPGQGTFVWLLIQDQEDSVFQATQLMKNGAPEPNPSIAVAPDGTVFAAWAEKAELTNYDIYYQRLKADGTVIDENPKPLSQKTLAEKSPVLSISEGGVVFAAWTEHADEAIESAAVIMPPETALFSAASVDGGGSFSSGVQVNDLSGFDAIMSMRPSLAPGPPGTLYIVWENDSCGDGCIELVFDIGKIDTTGFSFGLDQEVRRLDQESLPLQHSPSIAWDGASGIYIAFVEEGSDDLVYLAKSTEEGAPFSFSRISDVAGFPKLDASIAVDRAGRVFSVWNGPKDNESGNLVWFAWGE